MGYVPKVRIKRKFTVPEGDLAQQKTRQAPFEREGNAARTGKRARKEESLGI